MFLESSEGVVDLPLEDAGVVASGGKQAFVILGELHTSDMRGVAFANNCLALILRARIPEDFDLAEIVGRG